MISYSDMGLGICIAAFFISLCDIIFTLVEKRTSKTQNKLYIALMFILMSNAANDIISIIADKLKTNSERGFLLREGSAYVYFLIHTLMSPLFFLYISYVVGKNLRRRSGGGLKEYLADRYQIILIIVNEIIIALNPVTDWIFIFDDNRDFHRAWGEYVFVYASSAVWMLAAFIIVMRSRHIMSPTRKNAIIFCYFIGLTGVLIQMFYSRIRSELLMETLGFTGVLLFVENEDDRKDVTAGAYNTAAFKLDLLAAVQNDVTTELIIVRDIASETYPLPIGIFEGNAPEYAVAEYLKEMLGKHSIYSIGRGKLAAVLYNKTAEEAREAAESISRRFSEPWEISGIEVRMSGTVLTLNVPERAASADDVLYIADCPLPENAARKVMSGSDLDWIVRRSALEAAVKRGLANGSFEVYYQPTYTIGRQLHGAEALLRMKDKELGNVFPDEFIPVAEQLGLIGDIDEYVFREVCALLATGEPQRSGIQCINVNLSVLECMRDGFAERIISIADEMHLNAGEVVFEITETVAAEDQKRISAVIEKLGSRGFTFAIDDFGTGYSNLSATLSLGAELIKIDKSVLWGAKKGELGNVLLAATVKMIKEMRRRSLAEGVEDEQQIELLEELGCDYLQGFFFARPLPKEEFLRFIRCD